MQIANPIYDAVFKYLMEDSKSAKLLISSIIGEKILALDFLPQEDVIELDRRSLTVYRLDFSAKIETPTGHKNVLIEIQKAKFATDIMRFRRYLGKQYQRKENQINVIKDGQEQKWAMPILTIYFLGHKLEHIKVPVIKVNRQYYDVTTGKELKEREEFIESLTHDSYVIQIPYLRQQHRTEIEQLLYVFDQRNVTANQQVLEIKETDYPVKFRLLIRRLQRAIAEPEIRRKMDAEDEILEDLQEMERDIAEKEKLIKRHEKVIEYNEKVIEDNKKVIEDKDKIIENKDKIIAELQKKLTG